jgi:hypothetical protein
MMLGDLHKRGPFYFIYFALLLLMAGCSILWVLYSNYPPGWDFRNNLYLPSYLMLQHQSPYNIHVLVDNSNAVWLPMVLGVFFPLGYLDLQKASNLWMLINLGALFALIMIADGQKKPALLRLVFVGLYIFIIPSTLAHINLGQLSILICLALIIVIWFDEKLPMWASGFLLAFASTKPQLTVILIPAYLFYVLRSRGWRSGLGLGCWILMGGLFLSFPVMLTNTNWFEDFLANLKTNPVWEHPSVFIVFSSSLNEFGQLLRFSFLLVGLIIAFYWIAKSEKKDVFLWILALTTVFSPYIWSWDFVILYPLMVYSMFQKKRVFVDCLLFGGYFFIIISFITLKIAGQNNDVHFWWVPWSVLAVTFISQWLSDKYKEITL